MLTLNNLVGFWSKVGEAIPTITGGFESTATTACDEGTGDATFSAQDIGTAAAGRVVVVVASITMVTGSAATIDGVTLNGNAMTQVVQVTDFSTGNVNIGIYAIVEATGGTGTIVVQTGGSGGETVGISVYALYGANVTATDSDSATGSLGSISLSTVTIPTGGFGIFGHCNVTQTTAITWTNANEDSDVNTSTPEAHRHSAASTSTAGTPTVTADGATAQQGIVGAAFEPAA